MPWDVVVVAVHRGNNNCRLRDEINLLQELDILLTDEILFVEDACEDAGSAGSVLNALLISAERLSARAGFSILSEEVFYNSTVLILLIGPTKGAFQPLTKPDEWGLLPDTVIVKQLNNLDKLGALNHKGVWICGTDSCFSMENVPELNLSNSAISAFTFSWQTDTLHGSYLLNNLNDLCGIEYPSITNDPSPIVLSLLYFPPSVGATILSLHSVYPLSASTYYGEDTGTLGLKLSLFFDLLMATCLERDVYLENELGEEKIHQNKGLRRDARAIIWDRMHEVKSNLVKLEAYGYYYFKGDEPQIEKHRSEWLDSLSKRISSTIPNYYKKIDTLPTYVAMDKIYGYEIREKVMETLWKVMQSDSLYISRTLYVLSDFLYLMAKGRGGLRMGPAANPAFTKIFGGLRESSTPSDQIREIMRTIQEDWMSDEYKLVRGARHVEAAAQIIYGRRTVSLKPHRNYDRFKGGNGVMVRAAVRVDIFGGWLDTPPITYETSSSAVINMAIKVDNQLPLYCEVRPSPIVGITLVSEQQTVTFTSSAEVITTATRPSDYGALVCACFLSLDLLQQSASLEMTLSLFFNSPGITVICSSSLPHGSGLGTSSILACCIISALLGEIPDKEDLIHLVLYVEHLLTTGGGWQDQVGGIYGGIKIGEFREKVTVRTIPISREFEQEINSRLVLIYTGKTRLAKNLLQEVIRNWYTGEDVVELLQSMQNEVSKCENVLKNEKFPSDHVELYYRIKKRLATGCEPQQVALIIQKLKTERICEVAWLAGAGGGGFLYTWLTPGRCIDDVRAVLAGTTMTAHSLEICDNPLLLQQL